jgi:hypothetical protein
MIYVTKISIAGPVLVQTFSDLPHRAFAGLDLGELGDELPGAAVEVGHDGLTLGVEAEA